MTTPTNTTTTTATPPPPTAPEVKPPPKITIDGVTVEFKPGETIMNVVDRTKITESLPRYCYHPGLSIAGSCRMCQVEVEKAPKLMTACSSPAGDGMIVHTKSEKVKKSREGVMETLLANHPLDCPVCDQAGECSLQNYNFEYGPNTSKMKEPKRVFEDKTTYKLSEELTINMNRCVHCERCIRFTEDVTKTNELIMVGRGWRKEIVTAGDAGMKNDYQGCISEICPVGAFTYTDFRFKKRVWFLKKSPTVCDGCSKGCNVFADTEHDVVYRLRSRENQKVNSYWMCDEGRKSFHTYENRVTSPRLAKDLTKAVSWKEAIAEVSEKLVNAKRVLVVIGTDATSEEAIEIINRMSALASSVEIRFHNGVNGVTTSQDNKKIDSLLKQSDKTANTKGLEALNLKPLSKSDNGFDFVLHYRSGRAAIISNSGKYQVACGVFKESELNSYQVILPGLTPYEKSGSYTNCDGIEQSFKQVIKPNPDVASVSQIFNALEEVIKANHLSSKNGRAHV